MFQRYSRTLVSLTAAIVIGVLPSCGAGSLEPVGKPTAPTAPAIEIQTAALPAAHRDAAYPITQLSARGAQGPVRWILVEGRLPGGLHLSEAGLLSGQATEEGLFPFTVAATDGYGTDSAALLLGVETFGLTVTGLHFGDAWTNAPVTLLAAGSGAQIRFEATLNESGGAFDLVDPATGRAVWVPGLAQGECVDRLVAVDTESGATAEAEIRVMPHPAAHMTAEFGSSDVWYVDFGRRLGSHDLPRDFDEVLVGLGLRSTLRTPTEADELADFLLRREILSNLYRLFGRGEDGSGAGLPISFPLECPGAECSAPAPGTWSHGAAGRYNVISVVHGSRRGIAGQAFLDSRSNELIENDTTSAAMGELGIFANQFMVDFNAAFQNTWLPENPVDAGDVTTLRDLVYGRPVSGSRPEAIQKLIENFGHVTALIVAHEIGHSLGLEHTNPSTVDSLMSSFAPIYPGADPTFSATDLASLQHGLPGLGRTSTTSKPGPASLPAGGIQACQLRVNFCREKPTVDCGCGHGHAHD